MEMIEQIVNSLAERFGRIPSEDEVTAFIMGDINVRTRIWNQEK